MSPLVSVITPTWQRAGLLLDRCIPSVLAQDHPAVEHIIVSDGWEPDLYPAMLERYRDEITAGRIRYDELPAHDPARHWGAAARRAGIEVARGDLVAYVDDDDALRPQHVTALAGMLASFPSAGFAVSRMVSHLPSGDTTIGSGPLLYGQVGTPMLMHRREILDVATWGEPSACEDWDLVAAWMNAGIKHIRVDAETCDVYPSAYGGGPS